MAGAFGFERNLTMKVYCKASPGYNLTIKNGKVVLAPSDPYDESQLWYIDETYSSIVKDENGFPGFSLINKATREAIKHPTGAHEPVQVEPFTPNVLNESIIWSALNEDSDGYKAVRMVNNIRLNLDAFITTDTIKNGTTVGVWEWNNGDNQKWMIEPNTARVHCKADPNYNLTIRAGRVVLAPADRFDESQFWYEDLKFAKDEQGFLSFSLINKATGEAMKHPIDASLPVQVVPYQSDVLDKSILWTSTNDIRNDYTAIRMVNNVHLNLDAFTSGGRIYDGAIVGVWEWNGGDNQIWMGQSN